MGFLKHNQILGRIVGAAMLLMVNVVARGEPVSAPDYKVKAGFIYNFAKLTQWPTNAFESNTTPIRIGVVGSDSLAEYLDDQIDGRYIEGRRLTVTRFKPSTLVTNCHILFISGSAGAPTDLLPTLVRDGPILTIGESPGFIAAGGIIRLVKQEDALQFEVKRSAAERAGLRFSSKLLALARIVPEEKRP